MADNSNRPLEVIEIYRYPVKGLSPEPLQKVCLTKGATLPFDRAYAIENGKGKFDNQQPKYLPKINFLMLMRNERLARLKTGFEDDTHQLTISLQGKEVVKAALNSRSGRQIIENFMAEYMREELKGVPRIVFAADHSFSDVAAKCLHIINLNSVRKLERLMGQTINPLRFRANLIIDGLEPFAELEWVGNRLATNTVELEVFKRTMRCPATNVDPQKGIRDRAIPDFLFEHFGHRDFGIYARVTKGGELARGEKLLLSQK